MRRPRRAFEEERHRQQQAERELAVSCQDAQADLPAVNLASLADLGLTHPANAVRRADVLRTGQHALGNRFLQRVLRPVTTPEESISAGRPPLPVQRGLLPGWGGKDGRTAEEASGVQLLPMGKDLPLQRQDEEEEEEEERAPTTAEINEKKKELGIERGGKLVKKALRVLEQLGEDMPLSSQTNVFTESFGKLDETNRLAVKGIFDHIDRTLNSKTWDFKSGTCKEKDKPGAEIKCAQATIGGNTIKPFPCFGETPVCAVGPTTVHEAAHNAGAIDGGTAINDAYAIEAFAVAAENVRLK